MSDLTAISDIGRGRRWSAPLGVHSNQGGQNCTPKLRRVNVQVLRRLHIGHASILDQAHRLKLELSRKLPSLHDPPPGPIKTPNSVSSEPGAGHSELPPSKCE